MSKLEEVQTLLADFKGLSFEDNDYVTVHKGYDASPSGKETWSKINGIVRDNGGEWVSAGKMSHWRFPKNVARASGQKYSDQLEEIARALRAEGK